ncbi:unnamed protein product [Urochloa humidicola]
MDGSELTTLVCKQCPRLMHLKVYFMLTNAFDISIRSDSLQSLNFSICNARLLEVVAPRLEKINVSLSVDEARISAPKLAEVVWSNNTYDPRHHQFHDVGRRLRLLELCECVPLMQQFDEVDELKLGAYIPQGIAGYESFLNETNKLPKCKILSISLMLRHHGLVPGMLHLLRSCSSTRKVSLIDCSDRELRYPCLPSCPCRFEESHEMDGISLSSLEEVVMKYRMNSPPPPTKEVREKIRSMFRPNIEVEFYVLCDWKWVRLD